MTNTQHTAEPMLTPGETREARTPDGGTVKIYSVANGAFTHVRLTRPDGSLAMAHSYRFETTALVDFAAMKRGE